MAFCTIPTAMGCGCCRLLLSQHPDVEENLVRELATHGLLATAEHPEPRPVEFEDLNRLVYLECILKESMRIFPGGHS